MNKTKLLLITGFVILWNSGFIGAEYALRHAGTFSLMFWRYLALSSVLFIYLLWRKRFTGINRQAVFTNMLVGVLAHGVWLSCVLLALAYEVPAGIVALVVALQPLATGAFSGMVTGEPTPLFRRIGLLIGFGGVAVSVLSGMDFSRPESVFGYLIPLGSVVGITAATLIQRKMEIINAKSRLPLDTALFFQSFATLLALIVPAVLADQLQADWNIRFIGAMLWLVLAVSFGAYALMWLLLKRIDAVRMAGLFYLGPPLTMLMAWVAFGDTPAVADFIGLLLVFAGVSLIQLKTGKNK